jgi:hypothetical protein
MARWQLAFYAAEIGGKATNLWATKDENGKSATDKIQEWTEAGWELVEVTPIIDAGKHGGRTESLLFTFRRPAEP